MESLIVMLIEVDDDGNEILVPSVDPPDWAVRIEINGLEMRCYDA